MSRHGLHLGAVAGAHEDEEADLDVGPHGSYLLDHAGQLVTGDAGQGLEVELAAAGGPAELAARRRSTIGVMSRTVHGPPTEATSGGGSAGTVNTLGTSIV